MSSSTKDEHDYHVAAIVRLRDLAIEKKDRFYAEVASLHTNNLDGRRAVPWVDPLQHMSPQRVADRMRHDSGDEPNSNHTLHRPREGGLVPAPPYEIEVDISRYEMGRTQLEITGCDPHLDAEYPRTTIALIPFQAPLDPAKLDAELAVAYAVARAIIVGLEAAHARGAPAVDSTPNGKKL